MPCDDLEISFMIVAFVIPPFTTFFKESKPIIQTRMKHTQDLLYFEKEGRKVTNHSDTHNSPN